MLYRGGCEASSTRPTGRRPVPQAGPGRGSSGRLRNHFTWAVNSFTENHGKAKGLEWDETPPPPQTPPLSLAWGGQPRPRARAVAGASTCPFTASRLRTQHAVGLTALWNIPQPPAALLLKGTTILPGRNTRCFQRVSLYDVLSVLEPTCVALWPGPCHQRREAGHASRSLTRPLPPSGLWVTTEIPRPVLRRFSFTNFVGPP